MKVTSFWPFGVTIVTLSLIMGSCTKEKSSIVPFQHVSLRLALPTDPSTFDPRQARNLLTIDVVRLMFSGLTKLTPNGSTSFDLAQKIECSANGLSYYITLKKALWSDGTPITAHDFAYSWKSMLDKQRAAPNAFQLFWIRNAKAAYDQNKSLDEIGIQVLDDTTFKIDLEMPCPFFEQLLATPAYLAVQRQYAMVHDQYDEGICFPISGPYMLAEKKTRNTIKLIANPRSADYAHLLYHDLVFSIVDDATALAMVEAHALDWAGSPMGTLPIDSLSALAAQKKLHINPAAGTAFLRVNVTHPLLSDRRLREALSIAIDRSSIVTHLLQGGQIPAYSLVPPCLFTIRPSQNLMSIPRAKELISVYCHEKKCSPEALTFSLDFPADNRSTKIAMAIQQDITHALGIDVRLHPCDSKQFYAKMSSLDYDMALSSWIADYFDPHTFYSVFERRTNGTNNTGWESSEYQLLVENSMKTKDSAIRQECFTKIEQILAQELPIIPLYHVTYNYVNEASIDKITVSPLGHLDLVPS